jgi:hypothetical protein
VSDLQEGILLLASFLLSAARGLVDEAPDDEYGKFRCIDGARRALELLDFLSPPIGELSATRAAIEEFVCKPMCETEELDWGVLLDRWCQEMAAAVEIERPSETIADSSDGR